MDPIGYADHFLPKIEYTELYPSKTYATLDRVQYNEFLEEITLYLSGDCHAITVNDDIIINSYEQKSYRELLIDKSIRDQCIANPHSLFVELFRKNEIARVILYLFGDTPWFVAVYFRPGFLTVEYYKSAKYQERFGDIVT